MPITPNPDHHHAPDPGRRAVPPVPTSSWSERPDPFASTDDDWPGLFAPPPGGWGAATGGPSAVDHPDDPRDPEDDDPECDDFNEDDGVAGATLGGSWPGIWLPTDPTRGVVPDLSLEDELARLDASLRILAVPPPGEPAEVALARGFLEAALDRCGPVPAALEICAAWEHLEVPGHLPTITIPTVGDAAPAGTVLSAARAALRSAIGTVEPATRAYALAAAIRHIDTARHLLADTGTGAGA